MFEAINGGKNVRYHRIPYALRTTATRRETSVRPSAALNAHRSEIREIVKANKAMNPRVFGSVAHGDDKDGSDLDILVDPTPETSLLDIGIIQDTLVQLLGVEVDVLTPKALPESFRATVIAEAKPV